MEIRRTQKHMGSQIEIILVDVKDAETAEKHFSQAFQIFSDMEQEFSRFRADSSLNLLNTHKSLQAGKDFLRVVSEVYRYYTFTKGYFHPGVRVHEIGYTKDFSQLEKNQGEKKSDFSEVGDFSFEIMGNTIRIPESETLDFGGIVKGYTCDRVKDFLRALGYKHFLVNAGGDIWVENRNTFIPEVIGIENPYHPGEDIAHIHVLGQSIATSGSYKRNWYLQDIMYHHIISPDTGKNNFEILSVTLLGTSVTESDALATAIIAMGAEKALDFIEKNSIGACVFFRNGDTYVSEALKESKYHFTFL